MTQLATCRCRYCSSTQRRPIRAATAGEDGALAGGHAEPSHRHQVYSELVRAGFRRSGAFTYRPYCDHCRACVPVRILTEAYQPSRAQRRAWKRHERTHRATPRPQVTARSTTRCICATSRAATAAAAWTRTAASSIGISCSRATCDSNLVEFRENGTLRMVSIVDRLQDGLSSVYTFFEPDHRRRQLGTYNVMWQMELCRQARLALSLSRLLDRARAARWPTRSISSPMEGLIDDRWQTLPPAP